MTGDSVKQSQSPAQGRPLPVETQYLASPPTEPVTQAPTAGPDPSPCETKPTEAVGAPGITAEGGGAPCAVDSVKQSQPGGGRGRRRLRNADSAAQEPFGTPEPAGASSVKQSQTPDQGQSVPPVETQYLASPSPEPGTQAPTAEPAPSACQTKPTEAAEGVCRVPVRASSEETPYGVTTNGVDSVKQSQPAGPVPSSCETKPTEADGTESVKQSQSPAGDKPTTGAECAKQSQPAKPTGGFVMARPRWRYGWHYHNTGRP